MIQQSNRFGFTVLGSGSAGNATVIHAPGGDFLLDAGFTCKELCRRMVAAKIAPEGIHGILVTHEHGDHVKGCRVFSRTYDVPVYVTPETCRQLLEKKLIGEKRVLFSAGSPFELCGVEIEPFSIPHDVLDAVAFLFRFQGKKLGVATDLGCLNLLAKQKLCDCDALILESNHDLQMLRNSSRALHLKRRIMSRQGHLSNVDAMAALSDLLTPHTHRLILAHLSHECNDAGLVADLARERLAELNRSDVQMMVADQDHSLETLWLF